MDMDRVLDTVLALREGRACVEYGNDPECECGHLASEHSRQWCLARDCTCTENKRTLKYTPDRIVDVES